MHRTLTIFCRIFLFALLIAFPLRVLADESSSVPVGGGAVPAAPEQVTPSAAPTTPTPPTEPNCSDYVA